MKRVSLRTEAFVCFNESVDLLAHVKYVYFKGNEPKYEPDFEVKEITLTIDGVEDSPFVKAEGELFYSIVENDSVVNAIYDSIKDYEDEMSGRHP